MPGLDGSVLTDEDRRHWEAVIDRCLRQHDDAHALKWTGEWMGDSLVQRVRECIGLEPDDGEFVDDTVLFVIAAAHFRAKRS